MVSQKDDIVIKVRADISKAQTELQKLNKATTKNYTRIANVQQKVFNSTTDLNKALGKTPFAGYAMSIMFFGMALQRIFTQVWKFGTKAFQEISHSVEGTVTNTDLLEGSMKYLGFTIGQALEPLIAWLIPIVDKISDWVDKNPELVAGITSIGVALGLIFMVGGAGTLAYNGFSDLIKLLTRTNWTQIGENISKGVGVIAIGYAIKMTSEAHKELSSGKWLQGIADAAGGIFMFIGGSRMLMGKGGLPFLLIGVGLELVSEEKFFQTVGRVGAYVITFFQTAAQQIASNFSSGLWKGIASTLLDILDFLSRLNLVAQFLGLNTQVQDSIKEAKRKMNTDSFDFGNAYSKNLTENLESLKYMDNVISGKKEDYLVNKQAATREGQSINYYINTVTVANGKSWEEVMAELGRRA